MIWYEGSIANAVQTSKSKNAIFVVYVEGKDENSKKMSEMINHPDASSKLQSDNFVAVKLEAGSESYNQFVQIYQLVPVPSLFFIGKNGAPIEVIPQHLENGEFLSKIGKIMETASLSIAPAPQAMASTSSSNLINSEKKATASTSSEKTNIELKSTEPVKESSPENMPEIPQITTNEVNSVDKIERAKQIIEEKRELKRLEEEEEQRRKEIERRKMGQEIQKMRRQQQDQERKQIREEILREKNEALEAKQKILAQIQQDKEERAKKFNQPSEPSQPAPVEPPRSIPRDINSARLQFRFADGTNHTKDFVPTNTLGEIRNYVQENLNLPYRHFDLSTTFPRRQFSVEDNASTLADLGLIPNAVILVVPVTGHAITPASPVPGMLSSLIWFLISPIVGLYNYVYTRYNNWRNPRPAPFKRPSEDTAPGGSNGPSYPKRRIPPDSTVIRRQGNIHRLGDRKEDSDDDNNTWNGNSTQQM